MNVKKEIAKNLKLVRKSRKLTQVQIAEILGVSQVAISKYEKAQLVPDAEVLANYAIKFKVSLDYIFGLTANEAGGIMNPEFIQSLSIGASGIYGNPDAPGTLDLDKLRSIIDEEIAKKDEKK